jgi:hypothetical protein
MFPDLAIDHRFFGTTKGGSLGDRGELLGLDRQERKGDSPYSLDVERRHEDLTNSASAKVARALNGAEAVQQRGTDRRHENSHQAEQERFMFDGRIEALSSSRNCTQRMPMR